MRDRKQVVAKTAAVTKLQAEKAALQQQINTVAQTYPDVAKSCQLVADRGTTRPKEMDDARAEALLRHALNPKAKTAIGIKLQRLRTQVASFLLHQQKCGIYTLFYKLALIRALRDEHGRQKFFVIFGLNGEGDGTSQSIAQHLLQRLGRPTRRRLSTEVFRQYYGFSFEILDRDGNVVYSSIESFNAPPYALIGKSAPFVLEAIRRGIPIKIWESHWKHILHYAVDTFSLLMTTDMGSNNLPALRDMAWHIESEHPKGLFDHGSCGIHDESKVRNGITDVVTNVGRMYGLGRLAKISSSFYAIVTNIEAVVGTMIRAVGPPNADDVASRRALFDAVYDLESSNHDRKHGRKSELIMDIEKLLRMFNGPVDGLDFIHCCWDDSTGKPCCESEREAQDKMATAIIDFFLSSGLPAPTLKNFTQLDTLINKLIVAKALRGVFTSALVLKTAKAKPLAPSDESGARDSDMQNEHQTRINKLAEWIQNPRTWRSIPCSKVVLASGTEFRGHLLGKDGKSISLLELMDKQKCPVSIWVGTLWNLLDNWTFDSPWFLLRLCGNASLQDEELRCTARRQASRSPTTANRKRTFVCFVP